MIQQSSKNHMRSFPTELLHIFLVIILNPIHNTFLLFSSFGVKGEVEKFINENGSQP